MSEQNKGISDAEIAGIMGWRGPGAYTDPSLRKIKKVIEADREKLASQSPAPIPEHTGRSLAQEFGYPPIQPIPEQVAQASGIEGLTRYSEHWSGVGMAMDPSGEYVLLSQVERLLATQSAKQGAQRLNLSGEHAQIINKQVAEWIQERDRLQDLINTATGGASQAAPEQAAQVQADVKDQALVDLSDAEIIAVAAEIYLSDFGGKGTQAYDIAVARAVIEAMNSKRAASTDGEASHG